MFQSTLSKAALTMAGGVLLTTMAAGPAVAHEALTGSPAAGPGVSAAPSVANQLYKGQVIARSGLHVRALPTTNSAIVGTKPYGAIVNIVCKVNAQNIDGNPRWYKLADGQYAFAAARWIRNIDGKVPHFCA